VSRKESLLETGNMREIEREKAETFHSPALLARHKKWQ
jgi:hypothetical protein